MAAGSHVTIEIDSKALPIIPGVLEIAAQNKSGGLATNREHFGPGIDFATGVPDQLRDLIFDPQTSGGLLISVAAESAPEMASNLEKAGIQAIFVGSVIERRQARLIIG
jgi:selenide,water dikinase